MNSMSTRQIFRLYGLMNPPDNAKLKKQSDELKMAVEEIVTPKLEEIKKAIEGLSNA